MKKTKFLSLLVFVPLLASCGAGKFDEPKFAKYGGEVKAADFSKHFSKAVEESSLNKKAKLGSMLLESRQGDEAKEEITRNKKVISSAEEGTAFESKVSYDSKNLIRKTESSQTHTEAKSTLSGGYSDEMVMNIDYQEQVSKIKGKSYLVRLDESDKSYSQEFEITKDVKLADMIDSKFKDMVTNAIESPTTNFFTAYDSSDSKEQKNYKFYENKKVFTMEFKKTEEVKEEYYKGTKSQQWTIQIDLTEGKWGLRSLYKNVAEYEITKDFYMGGRKLVKGDLYKQVGIDFEEDSCKQKDVKLSALDIANYDLVA